MFPSCRFALADKYLSIANQYISIAYAFNFSTVTSHICFEPQRKIAQIKVVRFVEIYHYVDNTLVLFRRVADILPKPWRTFGRHYLSHIISIIMQHDAITQSKILVHPVVYVIMLQSYYKYRLTTDYARYK